MTIIVENNKTTIGGGVDINNKNNDNDNNNNNIGISNGSTSQIADKPNLFNNERYLKNYDIYTNDWIYQQKVPGRPYYNFDLEDIQKFKRDDKPWF